MNSIREALGMPRCTDAEYQRKQNELRKVLIRNWKSDQAEGRLLSNDEPGRSALPQTRTSPSKNDIF